MSWLTSPIGTEWAIGASHLQLGTPAASPGPKDCEVLLFCLAAISVYALVSVRTRVMKISIELRAKYTATSWHELGCAVASGHELSGFGYVPREKMIRGGLGK